MRRVFYETPEVDLTVGTRFVFSAKFFRGIVPNEIQLSLTRTGGGITVPPRLKLGTEFEADKYVDDVFDKATGYGQRQVVSTFDSQPEVEGALWVTLTAGAVLSGNFFGVICVGVDEQD